MPSLKVFVEDGNWSEEIPEMKFAGTVGSGKAIQAIIIYDVDSYRVHVQDYGWLDFVSAGTETGIIGKQIEAIEIKKANLNYQVHVQTIGWMDFARDGEMAGTTGKGYRIEAIRFITSDERISIDDERTSIVITEPLPSAIIPPLAPVEEPTDNSVINWYFGDDEFKCECGCGGDVVQELKEKMNQVRIIMGVPIYITSGYRCSYWNSEVGGAWDSLHMEGTACDAYVSGMSNEMVDKLAEAGLSVGLGVIRYYGQQFVHFQLWPRDTAVY